MFISKLTSWKILGLIIFVIYLILTLYSAYVILYQDDHLFLQSEPTLVVTSSKNLSRWSNSDRIQIHEKRVVHIWGKAAIGLYLWEHVLGGSVSTYDAGLTYNGSIFSDNVEFRFVTGPGLIQGHVPFDVEYLVLIVNGREEAKRVFAKAWLDYLNYLPYLRAVAVVMLGDEKCRNDWILKYTHRYGGKVQAVWVTYDSSLVDNILFYQWPLGVATYRNFPRLDPSQVDIETPRSYLCNFVGTVYPNSSRTELVRTLNKTANTCLVKLRYSWESEETEESLVNYVTTLLDSAITLSPVGFNSECYRIYEALSCGSIPVVEDVMTAGECGGKAKTPYRLLKLHNAPVIYVKKWESDLPRILEQHKKLSNKVKAKMRLKALIWYHNFIIHFRKHFIKVIKNRLLTVAS